MTSPPVQSITVVLADQRMEPFRPDVTIELRGRDGVLRATSIVDAEDAHLARHTWHLATVGYAVRTLPRNGAIRRDVLLHREILGLRHGDPRQVDHINRNKLDNRRSNLRVVSLEENLQNVGPRHGSTSRYRGVSWHKGARKWLAQASLGGKNIYIGLFESEVDAAAAASAWRRQNMPHAVEGFEAEAA